MEGASQENMSKNHDLCAGIFWIITDDCDLDEYMLLSFEIPCDVFGNPSGTHTIELNAKSGNTYNHRKIWENEIKNKPIHKPYNKMDYNYYPRGRVEIANDRATIFLNPRIFEPCVISEIEKRFGLTQNNISERRVIADGAAHYECWLDEV